MRAAIVLLALFALASPSYPQIRSAPMTSSRLDAAVTAAGHRYMADGCHVGLSITAVVGQQTRFYNFGSGRRDRDQPPTPDSVYELASVTKTFIGLLAARALLDGRMTLDADFRRYLPDRYPNLAARDRPITLRSLATHMSGLQRDLPDSDALLANPDYDRLGDQLAALNKGFGRARTLAALRGVSLRTAPGQRVAYSNLGIRVIGYGLEQVYHAPLPRLLRQAILAPLGMSDTGFAPTASMRSRLVTPHGRSGRVQPYHDSSAGAAYGLYSTTRDMARYLERQLRAADPTVALAHTPIRGSDTDGDALIWHVGRDHGEPMLWHGGGSFGETSQMVLFPNSGAGLVLLANDACEGSESQLKAIATSVRAALRG